MISGDLGPCLQLPDGRRMEIALHPHHALQRLEQRLQNPVDRLEHGGGRGHRRSMLKPAQPREQQRGGAGECDERETARAERDADAKHRGERADL